MSKNIKISPYSNRSRFLPKEVREEYALPVDLIKRAELLLPYKSYAKTQNNLKKILKKSDEMVYERYELSKCAESKKLNMLDNADKIFSVMDIDEEFFKIVNGRPLDHYIPLYKSLKTLLNSGLRIRQEIGYKNDCILNIAINFKIEQRIYELSLQRFIEQANIFDKFIMEDYQKSMELLEIGEKLNSKLDSKIRELQNLGDETFTITSRLIGLDYKYGLQQKYGRFLYYLSPPMWRANNRDFARSVEIEAKGFDFGCSHEEDTFTVMFDNMRKECFSSLVKPVLYFTHPQELVNIFDGIEKQQLYHFSREKQLAPHVKSLKDAIRMLQQKQIQDSAIVTASIRGFQNLVLFCEQRSTQLKEKFFKVLHGFFYENVGMAEVLKLTFHLEFCFEKVFLEKPVKMNIVSMAKAIESMYMDYCNRLDSIQSDTVRKAMKKYMELNKRKIAKAKYAAKELRLFHRLEQELLRAHNLVSQKVNLQSNKIRKKILKHTVPESRVNDKIHESLTDAEMEYLTLFTDWKENEDPMLYLQSLKIEQDNTSV